jgi:hypothetical protein
MLTPVLAAAALLVASVAATQAFGDPGDVGRANKQPKVHEVDYSKTSGEQGPATRLEVFTRPRADAVKMKAEYAGDKAKAIGVLFKPVSIHCCGSPWIPDHDHGRRELLNLMKASIAATGAVTVKVTAKNDGGTSTTDVPIVFSECHLEPPLYPFSCTVKP